MPILTKILSSLHKGSFLQDNLFCEDVIIFTKTTIPRFHSNKDIRLRIFFKNFFFNNKGFLGFLDFFFLICYLKFLPLKTEIFF